MKKMRDVSEKYLKDIYIYVIEAILILIYLFISNFLYKNIEIKYFERYIQLISIIFLFTAIYIFEKAYKKDDGGLAIKGIEFLIFSLYMITQKL